MNINTIAYSQAGPTQLNIAPNTNAQGTTETAVSLQSNPFAAAGGITAGGGAALLSVPVTSLALQGSNTASGLWNSARPFKVRLTGTVTTGTTCNMTLKLYQVPASIVAAGTAATLANDNVIATSGTFAVNTASANFLLEATLQWDSTSKRLEGAFKCYVNGALVAEAATTVVTTATATDAELNFVPSLTFSASNAANTAQIQTAEIEQM